MSDVPNREWQCVPARPRRSWDFLLRAADVPGLLAVLALAAVILVGSVFAIGACLIPG